MGFLFNFVNAVRGRVVLPLKLLLKRFKMSNTKFVVVKKGLAHGLTFKESLVLSYLCSLSTKKYVYASNSHICDTLDIKNRTLFRILSKLEDLELIKRETKSTGRYGKDRKIWVNPSVKKTYHT